MNTPFKICLEVAEDIREEVKQELVDYGRVPKISVEYYRHMAENDATYHSSIDPLFRDGGGPAVPGREQKG